MGGAQAGRCAGDSNCGWCEVRRLPTPPATTSAGIQTTKTTSDRSRVRGRLQVKGCLAATDANALSCESLRRTEHGTAVLWNVRLPLQSGWVAFLSRAERFRRGEQVGGAHATRCDRGTSCSECIAIPGCGWCHAASRCISGAAPQRSKHLGALPEVRGEDATCSDTTVRRTQPQPGRPNDPDTMAVRARTRVTTRLTTRARRWRRRAAGNSASAPACRGRTAARKPHDYS